MSVIDGDVNVMGAMLFGSPSPAMREHLREQHANFIATASPSVSQFVINKVNNVFEAFNSNAAVQRVQNALSNVKAVMMPDAIYRFTELSQLQTAQPMMQAYIMANPVVREAYHAQLCDGYSDTYVDDRPGIIGFGHQPYEHVMSGVVVGDDKGNYTATHYARAWASEDQQVIDVHQRSALLSTWRSLERAFEEQGRDPTSPWDTSL